MKRTRRLAAGLLLACLCLSALPVHAQKRDSRVPRPSPNATVGQTVGVTDVTITYGRPAVKGRKVFGELEPYGNVWRAGANEATTITFSTDVQVEGKPLAAGTYGLFTIPGEGEWTVIFNRVPQQWGAYEYDAGQDALRVTVRPEAGPHAERVTYSFDDVTEQDARVVLAWDQLRVPFRVRTDTDALLLANARAAVEGAQDWRAPLDFVFYALESETHLEDALGWVDRSIALEATYGNLYAKANVLAALGRYADAAATGEQALVKGRAMPRQPGNLGTFEAAVAEWKQK